MEEKQKWIHFSELELNCPDNNRFNIDTRDFHCGYFFSEEKHPDHNKIRNNPNLIYTEEQVKEILKRLYEESGGEDEWRMLALESIDSRVLNWKLKYIRIWRVDEGFIICNSNDKAIPKNVINSKVNQLYLYKY
jgi:hypothetical protein